MSRESILKVKDAEAAAERIVEDAKKQADAMIATARKNGQQMCVAAEASAKESVNTAMAMLHERTAQTMERVDADARDEVEEMRKEAFLRKRSAEKIVIRGLMSKCR